MENVWEIISQNIEVEVEFIANYRFLLEGWNLHMTTLKLKHRYERYRTHSHRSC